MARLGYRADIDGLRAVAVLPVVFYHVGMPPSGGFVGVDVFFVISGYLIAGILWTDLADGRFSLLRFYERRIRRIFPALFVVAAATWAMSVAVLIPRHLDNFGDSLIAAALFLSNIYFYLETGYFAEAAELKPLLQTWSLAVEEQFYIFFPPLLWLLYRTMTPAKAAVVLGVLIALSLAAAAAAMQRDQAAAFFLPHLRAWELLAGAVAAIAVREGWLDRPLARHRLCTGLAIGGMAAILWAILLYDESTQFPGLSAVTPVAGTVLILLAGAGACRPTPVAMALSRPVPVAIGKISYSLYLWHWPLVVGASYVTVEPFGPWERLAIVALSVALAALSWRFVEEPIRRGRLGLPPARVFAGGAAAIALALVAGQALRMTGGMPDRLPPELVAMPWVPRGDNERLECHMTQERLYDPGEPCRRGAEGVPGTFVWAGDSHARALAATVFDVAEDLGIAGYQYTGYAFRPLVGIHRRGGEGVLEHGQAFVDFLQRKPDVRTVYVSAFWLHLATGETYRDRGDVWVDARGDGRSTGTNVEVAQLGLARLFEAFPERRFVLIDDSPSSARFDPRHAVRAIWHGNAAKGEIGLPAEAYAEQRQLWEPMLRELAGRHHNARYVPIFRDFCGPDLCPLFEGGEILFRDGDHLSPAGARRVIPGLRRVLSVAQETQASR